jgi:hypothetical protein
MAISEGDRTLLDFGALSWNIVSAGAAVYTAPANREGGPLWLTLF